MAFEVPFTIWQGGQLATPASEDEIRERKDDSGGQLHSFHALYCHLCTVLSNTYMQ
jgi:hypothetical protein